jgi:putative ABC transport system substrate-binding protein
VTRRRAVVAGALAALAPSAWSQAAAKVYRIGILSITQPPRDADSQRIDDAFVQALRERGYSAGSNLVLERRYAEGVASRLPALAAELVQRHPDAIVVNSNPGALAAKQATATIPIVMVLVSDPVAAGLVASLARPGGNLTGVTDIQSSLTLKRLELLKAAVPNARRIANLTAELGGFDPDARAAIRHEEDAAAARMGLTLTRYPLRSPDEFGAATAAIASARPDALFLEHRPLSFVLRRQIAEFAARQRLPSIGSQREQTLAGVLLSYGTSTAWQARTASYLDRVLKGADPAELPIEQPTTFEFVVNLKTAKEIGTAIPPSLLLRADEVIE